MLRPTLLSRLPGPAATSISSCGERLCYRSQAVTVLTCGIQATHFWYSRVTHPKALSHVKFISPSELASHHDCGTFRQTTLYAVITLSHFIT